MNAVLIWASLVLAAAIVAAVAIALVGVLWKLKRGADHLEALAGDLVQFREQSIPIGAAIDSMNRSFQHINDTLPSPAIAQKLKHPRAKGSRTPS